MQSDVRELVQLLGPVCRGALERAAEMCVKQTNYNVEVEHFLLTLMQSPSTDLEALLRSHEVDASRLSGELSTALERMRRGNSRTPIFSPQIYHLLERAWLVSSLLLREKEIRSATLLLALLEEEALRGIVADSCPSLLGIARDELRARLPDLAPGLPEARAARNGNAPGPVSPGADAGDDRESEENTGALGQYTVDLTRMAREGKIDPVTGRDAEIRQILDVITRRRQNNPILTGEAGVGKTAIVEGFAMRVARGDVPPTLTGTVVRALDLGALQAGAGVKGEFENRIRAVIEEVRTSAVPIILFVDEAHTLIGAGGKEGSGDAANLLKPALARGELRMIAATTWSEYKRYVEKDPALARRFQVVKVEEPAEGDAIDMLRGITAHLEKHHGVRILDEAAVEAVRLSQRYLTGRQLPDKAISVLDTACARVALGQSSMPGEVEDAQRRQERFELEIRILEREEKEGGVEHRTRLAELRREFPRAEAELKEIQDRWRRELELAQRIRAARTILGDGDGAGAAGRIEALDEAAEAEAELATLQKVSALVPLHVDGRAVAQVISGWTGIPMRKMLRDDIRAVMTLQATLQDRVVGQPEALESIARRIRTYQANLDDPSKPMGVFLLVGPSGVGKTATAEVLAEYLYGGERNMISIDMSEFQEAHSVSLLKGAPPGYVGYGQGGILTEAVRRRPYSLVLLDEIEKAHPDVAELFYQVFDKGKLEDAEGQMVDFKNTLIILTSNVGDMAIRQACREGRPAPDDLIATIRPKLLQRFRPAFLARTVIIPYYPLASSDLEEIVRLKLAEVQRRFWEGHRGELTYDEAVVELLASSCGDEDSGARNVDRILTQTLLPELSTNVLEHMARGEPLAGVHIEVDQDRGLRYTVHVGVMP